MESNYRHQLKLKAKKQAKEIKQFYIHLFSMVIIVLVNLQFVPIFHFFWFALAGISIVLFFHWLGVFGLDFLALGKKWEERKMQELINNYN